MQYEIDTDKKVTELLNSVNTLVLDQSANQWLIFENEQKNSSYKVIQVKTEQFETLESLASRGAIYKDTFMISNTLMLISYMSRDLANETDRNRENELNM